MNDTITIYRTTRSLTWEEKPSLAQLNLLGQLSNDNRCEIRVDEDHWDLDIISRKQASFALYNILELNKKVIIVG